MHENNVNSQRCSLVEKGTQTPSSLEHHSAVKHETQVHQNPGNEIRQSVREDPPDSALCTFEHRRYQEEFVSERKLLNVEIELIKMKLSGVEDQLRRALLI